jgi:hypothetical protein
MEMSDFSLLGRDLDHLTGDSLQGPYAELAWHVHGCVPDHENAHANGRDCENVIDGSRKH